MKATEASAEPHTPMKTTATHSLPESFFMSLQFMRKMGTAMKQETRCSPSTIKLEASSCVRCVRKGASVAHSAAAKKTSAGPQKTGVRCMRAAFYPHFGEEDCPHFEDPCMRL